MTKNLITGCAAMALGLFTLNALADEKQGVDLSKLPPPSDKAGIAFATDIKPILEKSCTKCHDGVKPKGRLRLDSLEGVLKGGEDGKVVKPGNSAGSMLVLNIARAGNPDDYMPPPRNKHGIQALTKEQIGLIRAWIDQGAK